MSIDLPYPYRRMHMYMHMHMHTMLMPACMPHLSPSHFRQVEARRRALGSWRGGEVEGVWHARQTVGNACGAVAIAHLVMNTLCRVGGPAAGSGETARGDGGGETARGDGGGETAREARDEGGELARAGVAAVQGTGSGAPQDGGEVGISRPEVLRDFGRAMQGDSAHERGRRLAPALRQVHAGLALTLTPTLTPTPTLNPNPNPNPTTPTLNPNP